MSSYMNATLDVDDAALMMRRMTWREIGNSLQMTQSKVKLLTENIKLNRLRLELCFTCKDFQMAGKAPKDPNQDKDSQSLLAEQEDNPSQGTSQEESQQQGNGEWKCPKCPKTFKFEKTMKNHLRAKHAMDESLNESAFAPSRSSTHESAVDLEDDGSRKRKREDDDDEDSEEENERNRGRMATIEEEEINYDLLDDTFSQGGARSSTQGVFNEAAEVFRNAERVLVDLDEDAEEDENPDVSMERDKDKALSELENKLKIKDDLLHARNSKLAEKEADLAEAKELSDQKDRIIRKAHQEIKKKEEEIEKMKKKLEEKAKEQKEDSPNKKKLKLALEKSAATIKCLSGRAENIKKDLDVAKRTLRQHESETATFKKIEASLECTLAKLAEVEKELDQYKRERAALMKRIPCTKKDCQWANDCDYSHHLRYDDRSEPRASTWRRTVPCRFFTNGNCRDGDNCSYLHVRREDERRQEQGRFDDLDDTEDDVFNLMNQRFRRVRERDNMDSSVEYLGEERVERNGADYGAVRRPVVPMPDGRGIQGRRESQGQPGRKKQRVEARFSEENGGHFEANSRSGNAQGTEEWSRRSVPVNYQRPPQREPTLRMRLEAGRRSLDRSLGGGSSDGGRTRNWSPIRSPENLDRSRPRDRDLREEMNERRTFRGRGRGQVSRGRGDRRGRMGQNNNPEDKDFHDQNGRRYQSNQRN